MLLAIDAGNTNTVFALFEGEAMVAQWRLSTAHTRTADEYAIWLTQLMGLKNIDSKAITGAICASVVPQVNYELKTLCRRYFNTELLLIGEPNVKLGIAIEIDRPEEVGADRVVNAFAAWEKYKTAAVVVDFGTATTFDVVSAQGAYIGGVIAPGIHLSLDALQKAAAKLPTVEISRPAQVIGKNTVAAMQSGIYFGYTGLIEGIVARLKETLGGNVKVLATGGLAPLYAKATSVIDEVSSDLTMLGLNQIYHSNQKK
jgi:type III pantothenate kinase